MVEEGAPSSFRGRPRGTFARVNGRLHALGKERSDAQPLAAEHLAVISCEQV